jgi:rhamnopyranosyl-N-acetylglucosaminyl-diphospho-decaprenol beta-1,3/1,4-galactofuranosyltransferase
METKPNSVAAVVVTFNRRHLLEQVLHSLLAQTRPIDHIYVIDNASTDGTAEYLSALDFRKISCKRMTTNTGGAGGFSYGMKWAFDEGHEWIWLMDDDVIQGPSCLEKMRAYSNQSPILIPTYMTAQGGRPGPFAMRLNLDSPFRLGFRLRPADQVYPSLNGMPPFVKVQDMTFEGPLIHRSVPERIGFPRGDFFICLDDTEYAIRVARSGIGSPILIRDAHMTRIVTDQGPSGTTWRTYYHLRNLLYVRSFYGKSFLMRIRPRAMFIVRTIWSALMRPQKHAELKMCFHAFVDSFAEQLPIRYLPGANHPTRRQMRPGD